MAIKLYLPVNDPTVVNSSTAAAVGDIAGDVTWYKHPTYGWWAVRFVQFLNAVAYLAGHVVQFCDAARTTVTNDVTGGATATTGCAAGVVLMVQTQNYYGYILAAGYYPTVLTNGDDDIALGDQIIVSTTDGLCDSATTLTGKHLGYATAADVDANNTVAAYIDCPVV